jgi:ABC-type glycerol-3-phosphate transport system substrate-binding protein
MHVHKVVPTPAEAAAMSSQGGWGSQGINWFSSGKAAMIVIGRWYIVQVPNYPDLKINSAPSCCRACRPSVLGRDRHARGGHQRPEPAPGRGAALPAVSAGPDYGELIVRDGDALPPNPTLARSGQTSPTRSSPIRPFTSRSWTR